MEIHDLRDRVEQVESQISSQFTSLATYAQIAQEQVELARSEAKAATERSEQRLTSLIERERADRITSFTGEAPEGSPDITARLDALEHSVARIQKGLDESRQQQKELAVAITAMFDRLAPPPSPFNTEPAPAPVDDTAAAAEPAPLAPPLFAPLELETLDFAPPTIEAAAAANDGFDGPIIGLSLSD